MIDTAVFLCFEPPLAVIGRIEEVAARVDHVIVVDDGSADITIYRKLANIDNCTLLVSDDNRGLATSFNRALERAGASDYLVTFDQDTLIDGTLLDALNRSIRDLRGYNWGVVGPATVNDVRYTRHRSPDLHETEEIIQSAAVFRMEALHDVGAADESLVIDCVDTDLCFRLRRAGYGVYIDERIELGHPIGTGSTIRVLGRHIGNPQHSPKRRYFIVRNRLEMLRRYGRGNQRWALRTTRRLVVGTVLSLVVGPERVASGRATIRAFRDFASRRGTRV